MVTASPEDQRVLLDVQAHVSKLNALARQRAEAQDDPALAAARTAHDSARASVEEASSARLRADAEVQELERKAEQLRGRVQKNETQLMSGQAGSGTLQGLQREIESLNASIAETDEAELGALEAADQAESTLQHTQDDYARVQQALEQAEADVQARVAELDHEAERERAARAEAAQGLPEDLMAEYESSLARYGVGAAALVGSISGGSGMELSPGDLAEIRKTPPETVVHCPDSGVILVRE